MKKITSESFSEDDNLVKFLQTYQPMPPSEAKPCEELIMRSISLSSERENINTNKKCDRRRRTFGERQKLLWLLPITLVSAILMISGYLLKNNKLSPQMVSNYDEMDSFMIDIWQGSMAEETEEDYLYMVGSYEID